MKAIKLSGEALHKAFVAALAQWGIPEPTREFRFAPPRRWRFDYSWLDQKVALEVEGGVWTRGRHTRGAGFLADMEKYNTATVMRWRVFRTTPDDLLTETTLARIALAVEDS